MTASYPAYLKLFENGELARRAEAALAALDDCQLCGRCCHADRRTPQAAGAYCGTGRWARVGNFFPHFGEGACLRGTQGSGTIYFSHCNLLCSLCPSTDLSHYGEGQIVQAEELAGMMLRLQELGCHNLHLVTPSHVIAQILEALVLAVERGLRLPIVYNTGGYDALTGLRLLDGVVDIYVPDLKFWDAQLAGRLARAPDYAEVACRAIQEMHRQVGDLVLDSTGLARRGLLVRHLLLPGQGGTTEQVLRFLAREVSPETRVHLLADYYPNPTAVAESGLGHRLTLDEYYQAIAVALRVGLRHLVHD